MILHLTNDEKFINGAYDLFETYYPEQNHFFVQVGRKANSSQYVKARDRVFFKSFTSSACRSEIISYAKAHQIHSVLVHYLTPGKAALAQMLQKELGVRTYWIFYGADLYAGLAKRGMYILHDEATANQSSVLAEWKDQLKFILAFRRLPNKVYKAFIQKLDFFCFWNEYDYQLLYDSYPTKAGHKSFLYYHIVDRSKVALNFEKSGGEILVNHSATPNGNHKTVLRKIKNIAGNKVQVICPLSYGNEKVITETSVIGEELFGERFLALLEFLPMKDYYGLLNSIPVAIFGSRRQEAGGNVFYLLSRGAKVFLRNDNSMLRWLRDRGFIVFSFEDQLQSEKDLQALSKEQMLHNQGVFFDTFSIEKEREEMLDLFDA